MAKVGNVRALLAIERGMYEASDFELRYSDRRPGGPVARVASAEVSG